MANTERVSRKTQNVTANQTVKLTTDATSVLPSRCRNTRRRSPSGRAGFCRPVLRPRLLGQRRARRTGPRLRARGSGTAPPRVAVVAVIHMRPDTTDKTIGISSATFATTENLRPAAVAAAARRERAWSRRRRARTAAVGGRRRRPDRRRARAAVRRRRAAARRRAGRSRPDRRDAGPRRGGGGAGRPDRTRVLRADQRGGRRGRAEVRELPGPAGWSSATSPSTSRRAPRCATSCARRTAAGRRGSSRTRRSWRHGCADRGALRAPATCAR